MSTKRQNNIFSRICRGLMIARKEPHKEEVRKALRHLDSLLWTLTNMKNDTTYMDGSSSYTRTWTFQKHFLSQLRAPRYTTDMNAAVTLYKAFYLKTPKRIPNDPISICISAVRRYYLHMKTKGRILDDKDIK